MTWYPDLSEETMIISGPHVRAVGWLDNDHDLPTGTVSGEFVGKLSSITKVGDITMSGLYEDPFDLLLSRYFGFHTCELCLNFHSGDNIVVPAEKVLYVAPVMILHYVEEHQYLPPKAFVDAVLEAPVPGSESYTDAVRKFRTFMPNTPDSRSSR